MMDKENPFFKGYKPKMFFNIDDKEESSVEKIKTINFDNKEKYISKPSQQFAYDGDNNIIYYINNQE